MDGGMFGRLPCLSLLDLGQDFVALNREVDLSDWAK